MLRHGSYMPAAAWQASNPEGVPVYLVRWAASHTRNIHVPALMLAKLVQLLQPDLDSVVQPAPVGRLCNGLICGSKARVYTEFKRTLQCSGLSC